MCVARDKCRSDYEDKLCSELEQMRVRTDAEIDRLKTNTRETYERENRFLTHIQYIHTYIQCTLLWTATAYAHKRSVQSIE